MRVWIRMEPEEGRELLLSLSHRISDLSHTMRFGSPEVRSGCKEKLVRAGDLQFRIATAINAATEDVAWGENLRKMAEDAVEATATRGGVNLAFADVRDMMAMELMDEPSRMIS